MSSIAIDGGLIYDLPRVSRKPLRKCSKSRNKVLSWAVRRRNAHTGNPYWQPSEATFKPKPARSTERITAIREQTEAMALAPEEFWSTNTSDVLEYLEERTSEELVLIEERQRDILDTIEFEHCMELHDLQDQQKCQRLTRLIEALGLELQLARTIDETIYLRHRISQLEIERDLLHIQEEALASYASAA